MTQNRVVVTGMGVCAPNGIGLAAFRQALVEGKSGIRHHSILEELKFRCQVAGAPDLTDIDIDHYLTRVEQRGLNASGIIYGMIAGQDAWVDAGLEIGPEKTDYSTGVIMGVGLSGPDKFRDGTYLIDDGQIRRLSSNTVIQTMGSGCASMLAGRIGAGNQVTANSSACATGTEAIIMGYERIRSGQATTMLVGSTCASSPFIWAGFDAMRILASVYNDAPHQASRPLSASAKGFVPSSGSGALVIESLEHARQRGAEIYAEIISGHVNSGGQRDGGSLTAPNPVGVQTCIQRTIANATIPINKISAINGHLTATTKDADEIQNWKIALTKCELQLAPINSTKGLIGHALSASGSIESIAAILQLHHQEIYANINCEDLHPQIADMYDADLIPTTTTQTTEVDIVLKASFGFGDINACIAFKRYLG